MMSKRRKVYMVIDGNNQCFRAYFKYPSLKSAGGQSTSLLFGFPMIMRPIIAANKPDEVYVTFDGGRHKRRLEILPGYKDRDNQANKDFDAEDFYEQKDRLKELLPLLGINVVWKRHYEADDFIYALVTKLKKSGRVIIVSSDKDFHQLLDKNVWQFNAHKNVMLKPHNLNHYYGYEPHQCVDYLCMMGDDSDKIPGVKGVGEKTAKWVLQEYGTVKEFIKSKDSLPRGDRKELRKTWRRNKKLIDLRFFWDFVISKEIKKIPVIHKANFNKVELLIKARELSITKFAEKSFLDTYKNLSK